MNRRLPPTLLGGRVRTSTIGLLLLFLAVLALYIAVRPDPAVTSVPTTQQRVGRPAPASPVPSPTRAAPSRTPVPSATPSTATSPTTPRPVASASAGASGLPASRAPSTPSAPAIPTGTL